MLRASAEMSSNEIDLRLINGESSDSGTVEFSNELMSFATAVATRDEAELVGSREQLLVTASAEVLVDAAAVAGNFQRMVRIADAIGIPMDDDRSQMVSGAVQELELRRFKTAEHTPL